MRGSIISVIVNLMIVFFVIRTITKALKKQKKSNQEEGKTFTGKPHDTETTINMRPTQAKDLKHERTTVNRDSLNLKRCPNCGGEIPLTMLKCEICGHRQPGCGATTIIFILVIAFIILYMSLNSNGISLEEFFRPVLDWIAQL